MDDWPRRRILTSIGVAGVALAGCSSNSGASAHSGSTVPLPEPSVALAAGSTRVVMIIRHAEKPTNSQRGVRPDGDSDSESLTTTGWARAGALTALFAPASGPMRDGLVTPRNLIAANPDSDRSKRPAETVMPLAKRLGLTVDTSHVKSNIAAAAKAAANNPGPTLVSWEHTLLPALAGHLGTITPAVPTDWPDDRFDLVWVFHTQDTRNWMFMQVPQLLLAGDSARPIQ